MYPRSMAGISNISSARENREEESVTLDKSFEGEATKFINLGIVVNEAGELLMIRRARPEENKEGAMLTWAFPGGKQRLHEKREECVEREILTETGYAVESLRQISMRVHPQFTVLIVYHFCRLKQPQPAAEPQEEHEVAEIRWVPAAEVGGLITTDLDPKVAKEINTLIHRRVRK